MPARRRLDDLRREPAGTGARMPDAPERIGRTGEWSGSVSLDLGGWLNALCRAQTAAPADIAEALGIDINRARRVGSQLIFPPPAGTDQFELVVDRSTNLVRYATFGLAEPAPLERLTALFGPGREAPKGPHEQDVTMIFGRTSPSDAPRSCAVLARLPSGGPGRELVASVTLYLHAATQDRQP